MWQIVFLLFMIQADSSRSESELILKTLYFNTSNDKPYQFAGLEVNSQESVIQLQIKTDKDAFVCLTRMFPACDVQIHIGADNNTKVKFFKVYNMTANVNGIGLLSNKEYRGFWIKLTVSNVLDVRFGVEGSDEGMVAWNDSDSHVINYIGVKSGKNSNANWQVQAFYQDVIKEITNKTFITTKHLFAHFEPISDNRIIFEVKTAHDACIALTRTPDTVTEDIVFIVIGSSGNTQSQIRAKPFDVLVKSVELSENKYMKFIIDISKTDQENIINITRGDNTTLMGAKEKGVRWELPFKYFSVASDNGATAYWLIKDKVKSVSKYYSTKTKTYELYPIYNEPYRSHKPLHFKVMGRQDAYIYLTRGDDIRYGYHVMIGAYGNKRNIIRADNASSTETWAFTNNILKENQFLEFWIDWEYDPIYETVNGELKITYYNFNIFFGYANDANAILQKEGWSYRSPVTHFGIASYDNEVLWQFYDYEKTSYNKQEMLENSSSILYYDFEDTFSEVKTSNYRYMFHTVTSEYVMFNVKAPDDVCIILSEAPVITRKHIKICIGTVVNTKSSITFTNGEYSNTSVVPSVGILHSSEYRSFWFHWDGSSVDFGRAGYKRAMMSYNIYPSPRMRNRFFGVGSGFGFTASFQLNDSTIETPFSYDFYFFPIADSELFFRARSTNDVQIMLTTKEPSITEPTITIAIGADDNTKSHYIRNRYITKFNTTSVLNGSEFRDFRISWKPNGQFMVMRHEISNIWIPIMSWTEKEPFIVNYFGISSRSTSGATWSFKAPPANSTIWLDNHNCFVPPSEDCEQDLDFRQSFDVTHDEDDIHCVSESLIISKSCEYMLPLNKFATNS